MNNYKVGRKKTQVKWPPIIPVDKLSFLDQKVQVQHNLFELIGQELGQTIFNQKRPRNNFLDKLRLGVNIDMGKGYGLGIDYGKDDYGVSLSKDLF